MLRGPINHRIRNPGELTACTRQADMDLSPNLAEHGQLEEGKSPVCPAFFRPDAGHKQVSVTVLGLSGVAAAGRKSSRETLLPTSPAGLVLFRQPVTHPKGIFTYFVEERVEFDCFLTRGPEDAVQHPHCKFDRQK